LLSKKTIEGVSSLKTLCASARVFTYEKVYPSDANFILVKIKEARKVYQFLLSKSIVVRDRSNVLLCNDCLRITIGTEQENTALVDALIEWMDMNKQ